MAGAGCVFTALEPEQLVPSRAEERLQSLNADGRAGALVSFTGLVRADDGVRELHLEHYPEMTERSLHQLAERMFIQYDLKAITAIHRIGVVRLGEPIVYVGALAVHRKSAYEACVTLMDLLKSEIPLWKKEVGPSGNRWVQAPQSPP